MKSLFWLGTFVLLLAAGCTSPSETQPPDVAPGDSDSPAIRQWIGEFKLSDVGRIQAGGENAANTNLNSDEHNCVQFTVRNLQLVSLVADANWTPHPQEPGLIGYTFLKDADGPFRSHNDTTGQADLHLAIDYPDNETADWVSVGFYPGHLQPVSYGFTDDIQVRVELRFKGEGQPEAETYSCGYDPDPLR